LILAVLGLVSVALPASAFAATNRPALSAQLRVWDPEPTVVAASVLAVVLFARAFLALRRRGRRDHANWTHAVPYALGVLLLALALVSPLDHIGEEYLLCAHMLQHAVIGDLAPALLVLGARGPLTLFLLPTAVLRRLAGIGRLRRTLGFLLRPRVSFAAWASTLAIWHVPSIYDAALERTWLHALEHASFFIGGLLVWSQLVDPARRRALDVRGRVLFAGALIAVAHLFIHPVLLSGRAVYPSYARQPERLLGLSPLADQHWAAFVMSVEQLATLAVFLLLLLRPRVPRPVLGRAARAISHQDT
jgi:cytochrome c oxidase assembly factor CtaG